MKCINCLHYNGMNTASHNAKSDGYCALINVGKNCVDECPPLLAALIDDREAAKAENAKLKRTIAVISAVIDYCPCCGANIGKEQGE